MAAQAANDPSLQIPIAGTIEGRLAAAMAIVNEQADNGCLWFKPEILTEHILQIELRRLHAAIEGKSPEQCAVETLSKLNT